MNSLTDIRQTPAFAQYMQSINWQAHQVKIRGKKVYYYVHTLGFLPFSFIKIHRPSVTPNLLQIKKLAIKHSAFSVKISPFTKISNHKGIVKFDRPLLYNFYSPRKLKSDQNPLIPTSTIWIDLTLSPKILLKKMKAKTRYNIRRAQKNKLKIAIINGNMINRNLTKQCYWLWRQNNWRHQLYTPAFDDFNNLIQSFGNQCFVVLAHQANKLVGFCLILLSSNMAFYWHNAGTQTGKKLYVPNLCVWEAIKTSQKRGEKIFDFAGIHDSRYHRVFKNWQGFSRFKKGFVGL